MAELIGVAYARYSSDKQQESSITVQLAEARRFCERHNIRLIHEYIDEAQTGTNANRVEFQQMVRDAQNREFQFIVVHRMDRWARNVDDGRYYKKYFSRLGIKMVSAVEEFDETPEGEFFELMSMGMAELYSKKLARESVAGKLANARECKIHGGVPALGYRVKGKHYVIDEGEAEVVRLIFDLFLKGYGYSKIRKYLNSHGYTRSDGRPFTAHFYDVLRNRKYIGEYVYNRSLEKDMDGKRNHHKDKAPSEIIRIPGGMPRIIDDVTFFRVQAIMDDRKHYRQVYSENKKFLLSGMIECGMCGGAVCGSSRSSNGPVEYRCNRRERECKAKSIRAEYIEDYLYRLFNNCLFSLENTEKLKELIRICYMQAHEKLEAEKWELNGKIEEYREQIQDNLRQMAEDSMKTMRKYLSDRNCELNWEIGKLEQAKIILEERLDNYPEFSYKKVSGQVSMYLNQLRSNDSGVLKKLYSDLIRKVILTNDVVKVVLNLHRLLDSYEPINATIIEKRDNVAQLVHHRRINLDFHNLTVQI